MSDEEEEGKSNRGLCSSPVVELVLIGPKKAPVRPERPQSEPKRRAILQVRFPSIVSENLGLKPPFGRQCDSKSRLAPWGDCASKLRDVKESIVSSESSKGWGPKSLSIAKNHPKPSQEFSKQFGPSTPEK